MAGFAKQLPQRGWQGWFQKDMQTPQEAVFKCRQWPSLPEESKKSIPDTGRERNRDGVEWRSSWGREEGKEDVIAAERN